MVVSVDKRAIALLLPTSLLCLLQHAALIIYPAPMRSMLITKIIGSIERSFLMVLETKNQKPSFLPISKNVHLLKQASGFNIK